MAQSEALKQLRKYLNSQNLYASIRMTAAALIPAFILYHYDLLLSAIALPLGAIFTGFTDSPGPVHHRRNSLIISIILNFIVILITGTLNAYAPFVIAAIVVFGMSFSLIAVYGTRAASIGLNALIVFILNSDGHLMDRGTALQTASLFAAGGAWYALLSLLSYTLRPYKLIQQLLGECLLETAGYLQTKGAFYTRSGDYTALYNLLLHYQVSIRQTQDELREIMFKTRRMVAESNVKSRVLMSVFLDSIDLMERIMTSQTNYEQLHQKFDDTGILTVLGKQISTLSAELSEVGLALQSGVPVSLARDLDALQSESLNAFFELRKQMLNENNLEDFISVRQILHSLQDITERIKRLRLSTYYDTKISKDYTNTVDLEQFVTHSNIDPRLLINNLSLKSTLFRHSARLTIALLIGYGISLFYTIGHAYWILLTIAVIIKPAYSITRKRNMQRVAGTLTGAVLGFALLYFVKDTTALFLVMIVTMVIAYSFLKINYFIGSAGITLYVLMSFNFLSAAGFQHALTDRLLDTLIGSVIAWLAAYFILPNWEREQIDEQLSKALEANRNYFCTVAQVFLGKEPDATIFKLHRKDAFVALANLSDTFQRMLSEPKKTQDKMELYHQFVATNHTLTSYIASLSYYAQRSGKKYASDEFIPVVRQIEKEFQMAIDILHHRPTEIKAAQIQPALPVSKKVQELLLMRRKELLTGQTESETITRKTLSDLKTINNQFELINTAIVDEIRILEQLAE